MHWTARRPFVPSALLDHLDRARLRRAALTYAAHGWQVTPGAWFTGRRFDCGRPGCPIMAGHPAFESWADTATNDTGRVRAWWRHRPHSVLLATGGPFDALEVPAALGRRALDTLHSGPPDSRGPVAVTAAGRWMFLVRPGVPLCAELDRRLDIVRHGTGSWIPAAPSRMPEGPVRWAVSPEHTRWRLPESEVVQALLAGEQGTARTPRMTVPRQWSTARRAA
jgi:hypothetical protein